MDTWSDTTLDLSQKAEKGMNCTKPGGLSFIPFSPSLLAQSCPGGTKLKVKHGLVQRK